MRRKIWKKLLAAGCAVSLLTSALEMTVLADQLQEGAALVTKAEDPEPEVEADETFVEEGLNEKYGPAEEVDISPVADDEKVGTGDFVVGDATISIDNTTTIGQLVSMINTNSDSNVTAYWDGVNGELRMKSNNTGDFYINFEGGSSNFTDVMGFTTSEWDEEGNLLASRMYTDTQTLGKNAIFIVQF